MFDLCSATVRSMFDQCSINVRLLFDSCSIAVRLVFDYNSYIMSGKFGDFFENDNPEPARKLQPYAALIRECRRRRLSLRTIAAKLKEKKQISVAPSTILEFIKSQEKTAPASRRKSPAPIKTPELAPAPPQPTAEPESTPTPITPPSPKPSPSKPRFNLDT